MILSANWIYGEGDPDLVAVWRGCDQQTFQSVQWYPGYADAICTVTLNTSRTVIATYDVYGKPSAPLNITAAPGNGFGNVYVQPTGIHTRWDDRQLHGDLRAGCNHIDHHRTRLALGPALGNDLTLPMHGASQLGDGDRGGIGGGVGIPRAPSSCKRQIRENPQGRRCR